jgi:colanic acid biosynthesis glycosyl transferase WcaI
MRFTAGHTLAQGLFALKIGLLSQWYPPETGPATLPEILSRSLAERGHDVMVVTGFPNYPTGNLVDGYRIRRRADELGPNGVRVRRVALYPSHDQSTARRLLNYGSFAVSATLSGRAALREVDAFWVYNSPATVGLPSAAVTAGGGPPHLMHLMDLWPDSILFSGLAGARTYRGVERLLRRWCDWTYRQAGAIACISKTVVDELHARGVPPEKVHHIPVWTDEALFHPRPRDKALARDLGVDGSFTLLYAGSLGDAQGLDGLLEVCARLGDLPDFRCLIAGAGIAESRLRRRVAELRLSNTQFLGRWPAARMGALMSIGDVHLVSLSGDPLSTMTMPSKLPAILASGRAVVVSAEGEAARVVTEAGAGWAVCPGDLDAFEAALRDAHRGGTAGTTRLGEAGRRYYEQRLALGGRVDAVEGLLQQLAQGLR